MWLAVSVHDMVTSMVGDQKNNSVVVLDLGFGSFFNKYWLGWICLMFTAIAMSKRIRCCKGL